MATASFKNGINSVDVASINGVHAHQPTGTIKVSSNNTVNWPKISFTPAQIEFDYAGGLISSTDLISLISNYPWVLFIGSDFNASAYSGSGDLNILIQCNAPNFGTEIYSEAIFYLDGVEYGRVYLIQWGL